MNRILGHMFAMLGVGALAAMTPSCADNNQTIFIRQVSAPPLLTTQGAACTYTNDVNQPGLFEGTLDVAFASSYSMVLLVGSQLVRRGDALNVRSESNRVALKGAVVRVTDVSGNTLSEFTSQGTGFLDPASGSDAFYGTLAVVGVDGATAASLKTSLPAGGRTSAKIVARAFGTTLGGIDVESDDFEFPISVCNGCLVDFSTGFDPAQPAPNCAKTVANSTDIVFPCSVGQDQKVPCQLCQGNPVCTP